MTRRKCTCCNITIHSHVWVVEERDWCSPGCEREHFRKECERHGDPEKIRKKNKKKRSWTKVPR